MGIAGRLRALILAVALAALSVPVLTDPIQVQMKTDRGTMVLELYPDSAPATVENFLGYVSRYFYDGMIFHRVVANFVIQSGGYSYDLVKKEPGEPIPNESDNGLQNRRGTIAMARLSDPDSATSQFYINLGDNPNLDPRDGKPGYTVFGRVVEGIEVAEAIGEVAVTPEDRFSHLPREPVQILSIRKIEKP